MATLQKLTYRFTLDAFRNGIQRILQGWVTGEHLSRKLEISLVSGHDTYELPLEGVTASMYVTTPTTHTLSINACEIDYENNKIIYDVLDFDISEAGLVNLQLKVFDNEKILISPSFQLEVWESTISDSQAEELETYTALTAALAQAEAYAEKAIVQAYIDEDYTFVIEFADGTEYTSSALKDCFEDCEAERLKAEGWAVGKQDGEDVASGSPYYQNNAKYYSGQANGYKNMAENAKNYAYGYANDALGYKNDASGYATTAGAKATLAESYAVGGTSSRTGEDTDNAKYYKIRCEEIAGGLAGGLLPMGTILFASLPDTFVVGHMYNISDAFESDSRFKDGGGISYPAGTNVYATADEMWDCLSSPYYPAEDVPYDNTASSLEATDVQEAIDEVAGILDNLGAESIGYDNTESDLEATDVQGAVDELAEDVYSLEIDSANMEEKKADRDEIAAINLTGTTNTTGSQIYKGTLFYNKDDTLCVATADIAANATITLGTNCTQCVVGDKLKSLDEKMVKTSSTTAFDIESNASATFTLSNSTSFAIFISGRGDVGSLFTTFTSGVGTTYLNTLFKGNDITASVSGKTITIANASSYTAHVLFMGFNTYNENNDATVTKNT